MWKSLLLLAFGALPMFAGYDGTAAITYVPVNGTPTLSETMLIGLGLLLPVVAFRSLRGMKGGRTMASFLIFGGLLVTEALTGYKLLPAAGTRPGAQAGACGQVGASVSAVSAAGGRVVIAPVLVLVCNG